MISRTLINGRIVKSYLSSFEGESLTLMDNLFAYDGLESGFVFNPLITPSALLNAHLSQFFTSTFPSVTYPGGFGDIDEIFVYIDSLTTSGTTYIKVNPTVLTSQSNPTVNGHWYVNGNVVISDYKNLTIPTGYRLFINGSLTMGRGSTINGNVVVKDNVSINAKKTYGTLLGTVYMGGFFSTGDYINLGSSSRPCFIISEQDVQLNKVVSGYGFFISNAFSVDRRGTSIDIIGGVYANQISNLDSYEIQPFTGLNVNNLYSYAIPSEIYSGEGSSGATYIYTKPRY